MEFCGIGTIEAEAFVNFEKLEYLSLKGNHLVTIPPGAFPATLTTLSLANNPLNNERLLLPAVSDSLALEIPPNAFVNLVELRTLSLSGSKINEIQSDHFAGRKHSPLNVSNGMPVLYIITTVVI